MTLDAVKLSELLTRVSLQDRRAFSALYGLTSRRIFAIAMRILQNTGEAEDATQEIYLKIWRQAGRFDAEKGTASVWVNTIARNHSIDIKRTRTPIASSLDDEFELGSSAPNPEELAIGRNERALIDACLKKLPSDRAMALRQAYVEGHSYQELADIYQVPINTIRTWLRRSLITLRDCLSA